MHTQFKANLETAIEAVINKNCEEGYWNYLIHPQLYRQMAEAAEAVFDASQAAQKYHDQENP